MERCRSGAWRLLVLGLGVSLAAVSAVGCAAESAPGTSSAGAGGSGGAGTGGTGGSGGQACVPAAEACDGLDNDCNGQVDEGCSCETGKTQSCYSGTAETRGIGACKDGTQTCDASGQWGPCEGAVEPASETCNSVDDDCDGSTDEELPDVTCGMGACMVTVAGCKGGVAPACNPLPAGKEVCDGIDNDCNGSTDEADPSLGKACSTGNQGPCSAGKTQCVDGALTCVPEVISVIEKCDGQDNDCNGLVDDAPGTGMPCTTAKPGVCAAGTTKCSGAIVICVGNVASSPETCNGLDDDCDSLADEGNPGGGASCNSGQPGICANGKLTCSAGQLSCVATTPKTEACNNLDDDCDGQIDDGNPGGGGGCVTGLLGACGVGTLTCVSGAYTCVPNIKPVAETCNGKDDDCNGSIDDNTAAGVPCNTGLLGTCGTGIQQCQNGVPKCNVTVSPTTDVCGNKLDEDCDGVADDGCTSDCVHDKCVKGVKLISGCDPCVTVICQADPYCCNNVWDSACVGQVATECGLTCPP